MTILPKIHHNSDGTHIEEPLRRQEQAEDAKAPYSKAEEVLLFSKLVVGPRGTSGIYRDVTIYSPAIKHGWLIHHLYIYIHIYVIFQQRQPFFFSGFSSQPHLIPLDCSVEAKAPSSRCSWLDHPGAGFGDRAEGPSCLFPWYNPPEAVKEWKVNSLVRNMGVSENGVYPQWNSHLVGIMISKTIGCRGTLFSDKPIWFHMIAAYCKKCLVLCPARKLWFSFFSNIWNWVKGKPTGPLYLRV